MVTQKELKDIDIEEAQAPVQKLELADAKEDLEDVADRSGQNEHDTTKATEATIKLTGDDVDVEGTLVCFMDLMDEAKRGMEGHALESAILLLQTEIAEEEDMELRALANCALINAFLTRFSIHGWIEDVEKCSELLNQAMRSPEIEIMVRYWKRKGTRQASEVVQSAQGLLEEYRQSMDSNSLESAICVAQESIASTTDTTPELRQLRLGMGAALVMRGVRNGVYEDILEAEKHFQATACELKRQDPWTFIAIISLNHTAWIKMAYCGQVHCMYDVNRYIVESEEEDKEALRAFTSSTQIMHGNEVQVNQAITLLYSSLSGRPAPHPRRPATLNNLALAYHNRFKMTGATPALQQALLYHREALEMRPTPHPSRFTSLLNTANALTQMYQANSDLTLLNDAIKLGRELLVSIPDHHPGRFQALNNLATSLSTQFDALGDPKDLEDSITFYKQSLAFIPSPGPTPSPLFNNLAVALYKRFTQLGQLEDLEQSIRFHQNCLDLRPPGHSDRPNSLSNLANGLSTRYKQRGNPRDLDRCMELDKEALSLTPKSHSSRPKLLSNLAYGHSLRFNSRGDLQDLDDARELLLQALGLLEKSHSERFTSLTHLANVFLRRYEQARRSDDLEKSISLHEEALLLAPSPNPQRCLTLNSLAMSLSAKAKHTADSKHLDKGVDLLREALLLAPEPHPERSATLNNLGTLLFSRSKLNDDAKDLTESLERHRDGLKLRPRPHSARGNSLHNLAIALEASFRRTNNPQHLKEALDVSEEAAKYEPSSLLDRLSSAANWAELCWKNDPSLALSAYRYAMDLLPLLASLDVNQSRRHWALIRTKHLPTNAARCAVELGDLEAAVVFFSNGRSIFWNQLLQLRAPADQIEMVDPVLAEEFRTICRKIEISSGDITTNPAQGSVNISDNPLSTQWNDIVDKIRQVPGFDTFLRPPSFESIKDAAKDGPVIFLNPYTTLKYGCDALILNPGGSVLHVALPAFGSTHDDNPNSLPAEMAAAAMRLGQGHFPNEDTLGNLQEVIATRKPVRQPLPDRTLNDEFSMILRLLWNTIVKPVVEALGLTKTDNPLRLWWCPGGVLSYVPIHAAGVYDDEGVESLSDYAISSYCYSPLDLTRPPNDIAAPFSMLAVMEPEGTKEGSALPMTMEELERIAKHMPASANLLRCVGSKEKPTTLEQVLEGIRESSFVHFGCHGTQDQYNPLDSSLLLSGGKLSISRLIRERQGSKAVFAYLSACETAKADKSSQDQNLTLAAAMIFAGFRSVVGTMWSIYDKDAPLVADKLYEYLFRHGSETAPSPGDAAYGLHLAVGELQRRGSPFASWVPFVHFGI